MKILKTLTYVLYIILILITVGCQGNSNINDLRGPDASANIIGMTSAPVLGVISNSIQNGNNVDFTIIPSAGGTAKLVTSYDGNVEQFPNGANYNYIPAGSMFLKGTLPTNPNISTESAPDSIQYLLDGNRNKKVDYSNRFNSNGESLQNAAYKPNSRFGWRINNFKAKDMVSEGSDIFIKELVIIGSTDANGLPNTPDSVSCILPSAGQTLSKAYVNLNFNSNNPAVIRPTKAILTIRYNNGSELYKILAVSTPITVFDKLDNAANVKVNSIEKVTLVFKTN